MHRGFIKLWRKSIDNPLYFDEPFTRWQAWTDLILMANHKPGIIRPRGVRVEVKRGQVGMSQVTMSSRWKWSRGKVKRFLDELETVQQIVQQKNNVSSLITIVNYDNYSSDGTADSTANSTANGQQTDTNKNVKNVKKEDINAETDGDLSPQPKKFILKFDYEKGDFDKTLPEVWLQVWIDAYPAVDILAEISKAKAWLFSNPKKRKKDLKRFLTGWMSRCQERGGSIKANRPADNTNDYGGYSPG